MSSENVAETVVPAESELSPEKREILDEAGVERANLLFRLLTSEAASSSLNLIPGIGDAKKVGEGLFGQTTDGQKLTGRERLVRVALGVASSVSGVSTVMKVAKVAGWSVAVLKHVRTMLKDEGHDSGHAILDATIDFLDRNPALVEVAEKAAKFFSDKSGADQKGDGL